MNLWIIIAAVLLPPLGVYLVRGIGTDFWINVVLTLIAFVPGVIHALWIASRSPAGGTGERI